MNSHDKLIELAERMFGDSELTKANTQSLVSLLLEEAGETAGAIRSYWGRSYREDIVAGNVDNVKGELGDCLVIIGRLCNLFDSTPDECLNIAITKLQGRMQKKAELDQLSAKVGVGSAGLRKACNMKQIETDAMQNVVDKIVSEQIIAQDGSK